MDRPSAGDLSGHPDAAVARPQPHQGRDGRRGPGLGESLFRNRATRCRRGAMTMLLDHPAGLDVAIEKSGDFLLAAQDANGGWRDFLLPAGLSDSWVTAYV